MCSMSAAERAGSPGASQHDPSLQVTGVDLDAESLAFARGRDAKSAYVTADACALPFADSSFDRVISVAALCFIPDWQLALKEIVRVTRSRFAVGALNRNSLLWREKGQDGGSGAYRGAHWHTTGELRSELDRLRARELRFRSAIFLPSGSPFARLAEQSLPSVLRLGRLHRCLGKRAKREPLAAYTLSPSL